MAESEAALKNVIQQGVRIDTHGGQFRQGDETHIKEFSNSSLLMNAGTIIVNIQNVNGISSDGGTDLQELKNMLTLQYTEKIKLLSDSINDKQDKIDLLTEKQSDQRLKFEAEIDRLKNQYLDHLNDFQNKEGQVNNFLGLISHVDSNNTSENFKAALDLFVSGNQQQALDLLDDEKAAEELRKTEELEDTSREIEKKLEEARKEALDSKRKIAYEKFLKASFFSLRGDFKTAEVYYKKGIDVLSDNITNYQYAAFLISQNRLGESLVYFEKALELSPNETEKAKSLSLLALTLLDMNEMKKAGERLLQAKELLSMLHEKENEPLSMTDVNVAIGMGRISADRFETGEAIKYTNDALDVIDKLADEPDVKDGSRALCLANLGFFYSMNGQYDEAIKRTNSFLEISQNLFSKNPKSPALMAAIITSYNNLGRYNLALKNFELTEENLKKGIELSETFNEYPLVISKITALLFCNLGRLYADSYNKLPEAKVFFEKSIDYRNRTSGNDYESIKFDSSFTFLYLGRIWLNEKDLVKAEEYFKECLRIADNMPRDRLTTYLIFQNNAYYYYGNLLFEKKEIPGASAYWQKSIEVSENLPGIENPAVNLILFESVINVGKNYFEIIEDNNAAIDLYKKAFELDLVHKIILPESDVTGVIESYGRLFAFYSEDTDPQTLTERCEMAEKILERMEEILDLFPGMRKNYLWGLALSRRSMGVMNFQKKDYLSAEKWFDKEYDIFEILLQEDPEKYRPESLQLYFNACQNYLLLGDTYLPADLALANEKHQTGIDCLNAANQLAIEYPDFPASKYLKPLIDKEIEQLNAIIAAANASAGAGTEALPGSNLTPDTSAEDKAEIQ